VKWLTCIVLVLAGLFIVLEGLSCVLVVLTCIADWDAWAFLIYSFAFGVHVLTVIALVSPTRTLTVVAIVLVGTFFVVLCVDFARVLHREPEFHIGDMALHWGGLLGRALVIAALLIRRRWWIRVCNAGQSQENKMKRIEL